MPYRIDEERGEPAAMDMIDVIERAGPIRIAVVDDNWLIIELVRRMLADRPDMQWVGSLPCADDLVAMARRDSPDIVLLDVKMPGRSVFEVMPELRETCPAVRIIMFTSDNTPGLRERCLDLGACGFVDKLEAATRLLPEIERIAGARATVPAGLAAAANHALRRNF